LLQRVQARVSFEDQGELDLLEDVAELGVVTEAHYTPTTPDQEVLQDSYPSPEPLQEEAKKEMKEEPTKNSVHEEECGGTAGRA